MGWEARWQEARTGRGWPGRPPLPARLAAQRRLAGDEGQGGARLVVPHGTLAALAVVTVVGTWLTVHLGMGRPLQGPSGTARARTRPMQRARPFAGPRVPRIRIDCPADGDDYVVM